MTNQHTPGPWAYQYQHDTHIDTAMRHIAKELDIPQSMEVQS